MKDSVGRTLTGLVALAGVGISTYLVRAHIVVKSGAHSTGACNVSAGINCDAAAASSYSEVLGIPVAVLGLAGYIAALALVLLRTRDQASSNEPLSTPALLQTFFTTSVLYSAFLALVTILVLPAVCPACVALYAVNIIGLVVTGLWTQRGPVKTLTAQVASLGAALQKPAAITFIVTAGVVIAAGTAYTRNSIARSEPRAVAPPPRIDPSILYAAHAPARGPVDAPLKLVVFSDFECPYCGKFARTLTFAEETFGDKLRIEFRHFPLPMHQFAPLASAFSICAQREGRFWDVHDSLFADQSRVNPSGIQEIVSALGLNPDALEACIQQPDVKRILELDRQAGDAAGVAGTPTFFVNGAFYNAALSIEELTRVLDDALAKATSQASGR